MAKVKKVEGLKVFLSPHEAQNLSTLLRQGVSAKTREALGLEEFYSELASAAYWKNVDFTTVCRIESEE